MTAQLLPLDRAAAKAVVCAHHYLHSFPSGWTACFQYGLAVVVFSIPANKNLAPFLFGPAVDVRELARLYAPDGHEPNLLSGAVSHAVRALRHQVAADAVVSFADPNAGHHGGVYQASSWLYTGQSAETRVYRRPDGTTVARRAFHSGGASRLPDLPMERLPGKHRYVKPLSRSARRALRLPALPYPKMPRPVP